MNKDYANYLLEETRKNYNLTAESYTRTRAFISEDIEHLVSYAKTGERILDSGSASGRLYGVLKEKGVSYFGVDLSERLIEIAKNAYPEANFRVLNALDLPFEDSYFDKVYGISVVHNIPSFDFQLQYLREARRVLKPEGKLILRVWDFWKRKDFYPLFLKYTFLKLMGRSKLDFKDVFLPWKDSNGKVLVQRYFHCFAQKELKNLAEKAGFRVEKIWKAGKAPRANIYLIAAPIV